MSKTLVIIFSFFCLVSCIKDLVFKLGKGNQITVMINAIREIKYSTIITDFTIKHPQDRTIYTLELVVGSSPFGVSKFEITDSKVPRCATLSLPITSLSLKIAYTIKPHVVVFFLANSSNKTTISNLEKSFLTKRFCTGRGILICPNKTRGEIGLTFGCI